MERDRFDPDDLDPLDPFELDEANIPHLHKHGFTTDDLYDIWAEPDAIYAPARPDGFADWLLVGAVPGGMVLVVPLAPAAVPGKARPIGIYPAGLRLQAMYQENRR